MIKNDNLLATLYFVPDSALNVELNGIVSRTSASATNRIYQLSYRDRNLKTKTKTNNHHHLFLFLSLSLFAVVVVVIVVVFVLGDGVYSSTLLLKRYEVFRRRKVGIYGTEN